MRICILDSSYELSQSVFKDVDIPVDPQRYLPEHQCDYQAIHKATAVQQVFVLAKAGYDLFLNLCDGEWDEDRAGIEVVQALETLGVPFTGADARFFALDRERLKMACHFWQIRTPAAAFAYDEAGIALAARNLRYPMLVKHYNGYGSIGLTADSRVTDEAALYRQARQMIETFGGTLIEEFIDGREFTVLVAENADDPADPIAYLPVEFHFPAGETFKHFGVKWESYVDMQCTPVIDPTLVDQLKEMGRRAFRAVDGRSYGRCDIRMNEAGELFLLEVNPNCGIFYPPEAMGSADLALMHDERGHRHFGEAIIRAARKNCGPVRKTWQVVLNPDQQPGVYATQLITAGATIAALEEQPHRLISKDHVLRQWNAQEQAWFRQFAIPLTDEIYMLWSDDPTACLPLTHSCEPNAWFDGFNIVARRAIAAGEAVTLDYATVHNEIMDDFVCSCGAPDCRGVVRGTDYREACVARYGDHISDYVRTKRQGLLMPVL
jgi:D-alanine-D-alanine ligase